MGTANGRDRDYDRETITDELYEWGEYALGQKPGYLKPIADDAGVPMATIARLHSRLKQLDAKGHGGGVAADRIAHEIGGIVEQLKEHVYNASRDQLDVYVRARNAWIES